MNAALISFGVYMVAVFLLAWLSGRKQGKGGSFVGEYFLGGRAFGLWAFALTFAATNASGGTFMGFPALIYTHGWVLAIWIAGFMLVPLVAMGLLGKRLNHVARRAGAITLPEVLGKRFGSPGVGMVATVIVVFFIFFYLIAQFKAGGKILSTLLGDEPLFQRGVAAMARVTPAGLDPEYLLTLCMFSVGVIAYVSYGGFRAVVWTDVMQGVIMFLGVVVMLGLVLVQVGGLEKATRALGEMVPPEPCEVVLVRDAGGDGAEVLVPKGSWVKTADGTGRVVPSRAVVIGAGAEASEMVEGYRHPDGVGGRSFAGVSAEVGAVRPYAYGAGEKGVFVSAPGPDPLSATGFLGVMAALGFFIYWPFGATGQPANMVRLMSFRDTPTLRRSIVTVAIYYSVIYFSLVVIFCCGKVLMPGMEGDPDRVMPELASLLTENIGMGWLAGLLVAAPFAAVMSSVDSFILLVSSSLVRDVYQRFRPGASDRRLRVLSYGVTCGVGVAAVLAVMDPPRYLQDLIVFAGTGLAGCFLMPVLLSLYWPRMTAAGAVAGLVGGLLIHLGLSWAGYCVTKEFRPYEFLGMNPFVWDMIGSGLLVIGISKMGRPPCDEIVKPYFSD